MPIIALQRRLREAGRIRIGEQVAATRKDGTPTTRPAKLDKFRFTSADRQSIEAIASLCGGEVQKWEAAPVGEQFELYADCKALDVIVPPVDLAFSQFMELWAGGGCERRCDGQTNLINDTPCVCDPDNQECKPTTRLGVILTAIEGIGVWRLETHGWNAAAELNGAIEVLRVVQNKGAMIPARLLLEQRQSKRDGKTYNFAVPVLDLNLSVAALTAGTADLPRLASGVTPIVHTEQLQSESVADQLQESAAPRQQTRRSNSSAPLPPTGKAPRTATEVSAEPLLTEAQGRMIARLFNKIEIKDRDERLAFLSDTFSHPFTTSKELKKREASQLITELKMLAGEDDSGSTSNAPPSSEDQPFAEEPPF